ncbi:MAG: hypothetical protein PHN80_13440 [Hespellia sp.]|nr:hypothetical protein [Hespellia sp.]
MILFTDTKVIGHFLCLSESNWHNCCYVHCNTCTYPKSCSHPDFLFVTDATGKPILLPIADAHVLFATRPEPEECVLSMELIHFYILYKPYLKTLTKNQNTCPIDTLMHLQADNMYDW